MTRGGFGKDDVVRLRLTWRRFAHCVYSVRQNGPRGTLQNAAAYLEDAWFDRVHGTETSRVVEIDELDVPSANKRFSTEYRPSRVRAFRKLMAHLRLPAGRVFVDFGCGKGRILCAAAGHAFSRVVGVEFAPELCAICRDNLAAYRARRRPHGVLSVEEGDVLDYGFRGDEDVLFFFNPFRPSVMTALMARIHTSLRTHPRDVLLIVSNSDALAATLEGDPVFRRIDEYRYGSTHFHIHANRTQ